jgi:hypothetical protein
MFDTSSITEMLSQLSATSSDAVFTEEAKKELAESRLNLLRLVDNAIEVALTSNTYSNLPPLTALRAQLA